MKEHCIHDFIYEGMHLEVIDKAGMRSLHSDRSIIHSRVLLEEPNRLVPLYQQKMVASAAFLSHDPEYILHLGLGGGCQVSYFHRHYPSVYQDVIESSEEVIDVAHKYFFLPSSSRINIYRKDVKHLSVNILKDYDLILLDLCDSNGPIPHFHQVPFLQKLRQLLNKDGWVAANSWSSEKHLPEELNRWRQVFPHIYFLQNTEGESVIYAGFHPLDAPVLASRHLPENVARHLLKLEGDGSCKSLDSK